MQIKSRFLLNFNAFFFFPLYLLLTSSCWFLVLNIESPLSGDESLEAYVLLLALLNVQWEIMIYRIYFRVRTFPQQYTGLTGNAILSPSLLTSWKGCPMYLFIYSCIYLPSYNRMNICCILKRLNHTYICYVARCWNQGSHYVDFLLQSPLFSRGQKRIVRWWNILIEHSISDADKLLIIYVLSSKSQLVIHWYSPQLVLTECDLCKC